MGGIITSSTTWSGLIHVTSDVSVRNEATLTIAPGTKIIVGLGVDIELGWEGSAPKLVAPGTSAEPIRVCGETASPGYWSSLTVLGNVNPESILRNVLIDGAGASGSPGALVLEAPVTVQGVQVRHTVETAVVASDFNADSVALRVLEAGKDPIRFTHFDALARFPENSELSQDEPDGKAAEIDFDVIPSSHRFRDLGLPYWQLGALVVSAGSAIEFDPGVEYIANELFDLSNTALTAIGTEADPIHFIVKPVRVGGTGTVHLEHVVVQAASSSASAVETLAGNEVLMKDVEITTGSRTFVAKAPFAAGSENIFAESFSSNGIAIQFGSWAAMTSLPLDTEIAGSVALAFSKVGTSGTIRAFDSDIIVEQGLSVENAGTTMTIAPGAHLSVRNYKKIEVSKSGALVAVGSAQERIRISGPEWCGIWIRADGSATIDYATISNAGKIEVNDGCANIVAYTPISLTNSTISDAWSYGLRKSATDTTNYLLTNTFLENWGADIDTIK